MSAHDAFVSPAGEQLGSDLVFARCREMELAWRSDFDDRFSGMVGRFRVRVRDESRASLIAEALVGDLHVMILVSDDGSLDWSSVVALHAPGRKNGDG
jgi:hypothetical protein